LGESTLKIRPIQAGDETAWRELWRGYCAFYEVTLSKRIEDHTWLRIMDEATPVYCFVAEEAGQVVSICNYILHENTWTITPVVYLEDLFVDPGCRARGVGQAMIDWLVALAKQNGWSRVYWMTKENNYRARGLYDKYSPRDAFVRYVVKNEQAPS
jgi:GNAT superfamily N-acetyltransferase